MRGWGLSALAGMIEGIVRLGIVQHVFLVVFCEAVLADSRQFLCLDPKDTVRRPYPPAAELTDVDIVFILGPHGAGLSRKWFRR